MDERIIPFAEVARSPLIVDAIYQGDRKGGAADDPLPRLLDVSNQGGFRYRGRLDNLNLVVLKTSLDDPDWPDALDRESGTFIYFGDNKKPGHGLHETPRFGNELLRRFFNSVHAGESGRRLIPPIFVFSGTGERRDARFLARTILSRSTRFADHARWRQETQEHQVNKRGSRCIKLEQFHIYSVIKLF